MEKRIKNKWHKQLHIFAGLKVAEIAIIGFLTVGAVFIGRQIADKLGIETTSLFLLWNLGFFGGVMILALSAIAVIAIGNWIHANWRIAGRLVERESWE